MRLSLPDRIVAPLLALGTIALYLVSAIGRGASESGYARLGLQILAGTMPPTETPMPAVFTVPFLVTGDPVLAQTFACAIAGGLSAGAPRLARCRPRARRLLFFTPALFSAPGPAPPVGSPDAPQA